MKTSSTQIAQRYVKAMFDVTEDAKALADVESDFASLAKALDESEELRDLLVTPLLDREAQGTAADAVLDKMKAHKLTHQFIALLARQKRLVLLPEIIALFKREAASARGEMQAELISASPVSAADIKLVVARLSKAYDKKITLKVSEDPELLGGAVVKIGSLQLDSSLAGKMRRLGITLRAA